MKVPANLDLIKDHPGLVRNYNFFQYKWCPCTHYVFGVDKSGSMSGLMPTAHATLSLFANILDSANQGSPFIFYFSYFYFNHVADIPEYLHIKPFTPLPGPPAASGGTNFNNAILRGIQIINMFIPPQAAQYENLCFLLISDGGGSVSPTVISQLQAKYNETRKHGCYACSVCVYVHVDNNPGNGLFEFQDLCKKIGVNQFLQVTPTTYQRVAKNLADNLVRTRGFSSSDRQ